MFAVVYLQGADGHECGYGEADCKGGGIVPDICSDADGGDGAGCVVGDELLCGHGAVNSAYALSVVMIMIMPTVRNASRANTAEAGG